MATWSGEVQYGHPDYHGINTKPMFVLFLNRCVVMMITVLYFPQIFGYYCTPKQWDGTSSLSICFCF